MSVLSKKKQQAAQLLADGLSNIETAKRCKVSESSIVRWKRDPVFIQEIERIQVAAAAAQLEQLHSSDNQDIEGGKAIELAQLERLDEIIEKIAQLTVDVIDGCDPSDISPRALPGLTKALTGAMDCRRNGFDRVTGMDLIIDELDKAEEIFSEASAAKASTTTSIHSAAA